MEYLFPADALISLLTLTILEVVLGVDNVIFVSIIMGRLPKDRQLTAASNMDDCWNLRSCFVTITPGMAYRPKG